MDKNQLASPFRTSRRNFLGGALGVAGLMALQGCGSPSANTVNPSANPGDFAGQTIKGILQDAPVPGGQYKEVVGPAWTAKTKGQMDLILADYDTLYQSIVLDATSGTAEHDLMGLDILWMGQFGSANSMVKLNDLLAGDPDLNANVNKVLLDGASWAGGVVGLPATNQSWNLFYRKDVFEAKGIKPPENWTDFLAIAKELTGDWAGDGEKHYGVAMNVKRGAPVAHDWLGYFAAMGGQMFDNWPDVEKTQYKPQIDSEAGHKALQLVMDMRAYAPEDVAEYDWNKTQAALADGRVAMICSWNDGTCAQVFAEGSKVADKIGWARLPNIAGMDRFDPRGFWSIGINARSDKGSAAWSYLATGLSKDVQRQMVENVPGIVPVRDDLLKEMETDSGPLSYLGFMRTINENTNPMNFAWRPTLPEWASVQDVIGLTINQALTGERTPDEALRDAQTRLEAAMKQAGR